MKSTVLLIILFALISCNNRNDNPGVENFYTRTSGYDYQRIPLIKPLELIKLKGSDDWCINTSALPKTASDIFPIDSIFCKDSLIYGHKPFYQSPDLKDYVTPEYWFIINTANNKIITYESQRDFIKHMPDLDSAKCMMRPDSLFNIYQKDYILPWFNDSIKIELQKIKHQAK